MKSSLRFLIIVIAMNLFAAITPKQASAQYGEVSFQVFYDELSPYGQWVNDANYGYVWIPDVDQYFEPYATNGHWVYTNYGWTWMSDYPWGWAPFHYGRWDYNDSYGWFWVPDNEWGPAWVSWRRVNGYYGWAPLTPGISVSISFGRSYSIPAERWFFVRDRDLSRYDLHNCYIDRHRNATFISRSTIINRSYIDNNRHTTYIYGPGRDEVQNFTGRRIRPVTIHESDRPGQNLSNNRMQIYRPNIGQNTSYGHRSAPTNFVTRNEVKPVSERSYSNERGTSSSGHSNIVRERSGVQNTGTVRPNTNNNSGSVNYRSRNSESNPTQQRDAVYPAKDNTNTRRYYNPADNNSQRERSVQPNSVTTPNNNTGTDWRQQRNATNPTRDYTRPRQYNNPTDNNYQRNNITQPNSVTTNPNTNSGTDVRQQRNSTNPTNYRQRRYDNPTDNSSVRERSTQTNTVSPSNTNTNYNQVREVRQQRNENTTPVRESARPVQNTSPSNSGTIRERQPRQQVIVNTPKENKPVEQQREKKQERRRNE
ncbi:MAG: hypothetical protein Q8862_02285 [Bacteroidota bacterium]|nr:hypothetical protein [Bacteroidota bacterium]MDP4205027.1 hypothetical protein [Bacteroidota bacterium]